MFIKLFLKWLLKLFRWGSQTLEPIIDSAEAQGQQWLDKRPTTLSPLVSRQSDWLHELAAEVAELRVEVRQLKNQLNPGDTLRP